MNERDQELIVDLIDGRLDPQVERAALARLESDAEFRAEYETQMAISSLLTDAPAPSMTADERSLLRAALKQELRLEPAVATPAPARPSRWQRWLAPIGSLAAAAAVLAGIFVFLPQGADDSSPVALEATTTAAAGGESLESPFKSEAADEATGAATETTSTPSSEMFSPDEDAAADAGTDGTVAGTTRLSVPHLPDITLEEIASTVRAQPNALRYEQTETGEGEAGDPLIADCLTALRGNETFAAVLPVATTTSGGIDALAVEITPTDGDPYHALYALDTCLELESTGG